MTPFRQTRIANRHIRLPALTCCTCLAIILAACTPSDAPARACAESQQPARLTPRMEALAPRMLDWFNHMEARFLRQGRPLSPKERAVARKLGVQNPERVRVAVVSTFPMPQDPALRRESARLGLDTLRVNGRAMGYAILVKPAVAGDSAVIAHELAHVAQMERLGRDVFLRQYFAELAQGGYTCSPLEREARSAAAPYRQ